jgi:membrane associated rhomboid family serine protease
VFFPINTDAPVYYFPFATIGLIVTNMALFVAQMAAWAVAVDGQPTWDDPWCLAFGDGLHPLQWVTHAFLHGGPMHLIGNMVFLWGFGLVVEGKLGWWRFLGLYLGVAAAVGLAAQALMLGYDGPPRNALGASAAVFGLLGMAFVWAPKNEVTIFTWFLYRPFLWEATILAFCGCYFAYQVLLFALGGFSMGGALGHILGGVFGFGLGVLLLKRDWVDCEGWDLFAVMKNTHGRQRDDEFHYRDAAFQAGKIATPQVEPERSAAEKVGATTLDPRVRIKKFLEAGDVISALGEYEKLVAFHPTWRLDRETLGAIGEAAYKEKCWEDAEPLLKQWLERFGAEDAKDAKTDDAGAAVRVRLKLAKTLIDGTKKPAEGLAVLRQVDPSGLPPKPAAAYQELRKRAEGMAKRTEGMAKRAKSGA